MRRFPSLLKHLGWIALSLFTLAASGQAAPGMTRPLAYARNFEITDYPNYRLITVRNTHRGATQDYRYALVPKGQPLPELPEEVAVIRTPVERVVAMETVYIGYLDALGKLDVIVGTGSSDFITNPSIVEKVRSGAIQSIQAGQTLNIESILLLQPDLILTSITGNPVFDVPPKLERTGLPVVLSAGYMEQHPLARAEWIKFMAAFLDADAEAERIFKPTAEHYEALCGSTRKLKERPTVFCSAPYSGAWHMPGGESYTAQFIRDAGGTYLWADQPIQGNIPLDTERVFLKAAMGDIWLNPSHYRSLDALFGADQRFRMFQAARTGRVYNNTRQVAPEGGGNPIWEKGIVRPDVVLADLIQIFHPELMPDRELVFYEQLK